MQQKNLHKIIVLKVTDVMLKTYPFLAEIPAHILAAIDLDVLYLPSPIERNLIDMLTMAINRNIVIYKANVTSNGIHFEKQSLIHYVMLIVIMTIRVATELKTSSVSPMPSTQIRPLSVLVFSI